MLDLAFGVQLVAALSIVSVLGLGSLLSQDLFKQWSMHPTFASTFKDTMDFCQRELGYDEPLPSTDQEAPSGEHEPRAKRAHTSLAHILKTEDVKDPQIISAKMTNIKGGELELNCCNGCVLLVTNLGSADYHLKAGQVLCAFGKIQWKRLNPEDTVGQREILVEFSKGTDNIIMGTGMLTIQDAIDKRRKSHANVSVHYHTIEASSDSPGSFDMKLKDRVVAVLTPEGGEAEQKDGEPKLMGVQSNIAATIPKESWATSKVAKIMWNMHWVQTGLMPVRPQVAWHQPNPALHREAS